MYKDENDYLQFNMFITIHLKMKRMKILLFCWNQTCRLLAKQRYICDLSNVNCWHKANTNFSNAGKYIYLQNFRKVTAFGTEGFFWNNTISGLKFSVRYVRASSKFRTRAEHHPNMIATWTSGTASDKIPTCMLVISGKMATALAFGFGQNGWNFCLNALQRT